MDNTYDLIWYPRASPVELALNLLEMAEYTIPALVFESATHDATVVVSPAAGNAEVTKAALKHASAVASQAILAYHTTTSPGIDGQPVIAVALPNGLGFVMAFLGVVAKGAVAAPLNPAYTVPEFEVSRCAIICV